MNEFWGIRYRSTKQVWDCNYTSKKAASRQVDYLEMRDFKPNTLEVFKQQGYM